MGRRSKRDDLKRLRMIHRILLSVLLVVSAIAGETEKLESCLKTVLEIIKALGEVGRI